jgi:hypothetical protein
MEGPKVRFLDPEKLHVSYLAGAGPDGPLTPRRYTLTHSDRTGRLYLTIGPDYNVKQISGLYTRIMRDEVLGKWKADGDLSLNVHCHVSGGLVFGTASWRNEIFRQELPLVLESFRYGDRFFFESHPRLDDAPIWVHFESTDPSYRRSELWQTPATYRWTRPDVSE